MYGNVKSVCYGRSREALPPFLTLSYVERMFMASTNQVSFALFPITVASTKGRSPFKAQLDLLKPLQQWLDNVEVKTPRFAHFLAKAIPAQCPFERDITLFGRKVAHIPPLCKLNPLYEQLVGLRFRALCYLVDQCGEDIQAYS